MIAKEKEISKSLISLWENKLDEIACSPNESILTSVDEEGIIPFDAALATKNVLLGAVENFENEINSLNKHKVICALARQVYISDPQFKFTLQENYSVTSKPERNFWQGRGFEIPSPYSLTGAEVQHHMRHLLKLGIIQLGQR